MSNAFGTKSTDEAPNGAGLLRIAVVARSLPDHGGGGMEALTADLMTRWAQDGHVVTCFTTPRSAGRRRTWPFRVVELPGTPGRYSSRWRAAVRSRVPLEDFDVVMGVSSAAASLLGPSSAVRTPVVMQAHGTALGEIVSKFRAPSLRAVLGAARNSLSLIGDWRAYPRYESVIAVGPAVARDLRRVPLGCQARRIITIPNGVPDTLADEWRERAETEPRTSDIAFVGRLRREKGADLLIRALVGNDLTLVIAGDGPARPDLERLARRMGVHQRVRFVGAIDRTEVGPFMGSARVVALPSRRREGLPLVALESMALGRPVVLSRQAAGALVAAHGGVHVFDRLRPQVVYRSLVSALERADVPVDLPDVYRLSRTAKAYLDEFAVLRGQR